MKKKIVTFLICFLILSPSLFVYAAGTQRYTGEIKEFSHDIWLGGKKSLFHDNSFKCSKGKFTITTRISKQTKSAQASSRYFYCYVYRVNLFKDELVGCAVLNRIGKDSGSWKNMKHDNYRFLLKKENDGCDLTGSVTLEY